jgi:excisionase family DNA binding protein
MRAPDSGVRRLRLWTSADVCAFLGLGKNAPADLVRRGELRGYRIGRRLRFDPADVRAFADRCRVDVSDPLATLVARRTP